MEILLQIRWADLVGPVPAGAVKADRTAITRTMKFVGRVEAVSRAEMRAPVTGYLERVLFREGVDTPAAGRTGGAQIDLDQFCGGLPVWWPD